MQGLQLEPECLFFLKGKKKYTNKETNKQSNSEKELELETIGILDWIFTFYGWKGWLSVNCKGPYVRGADSNSVNP